MWGALWQQNKDRTWTRVFCQATRDALNIYEGSDATNKIKSIPLKHAMLREVTFSGFFSGGGPRHPTGFMLTYTAPSSREGSPRAVTDVGRSSDTLTRDSPSDSDQPSVIVLSCETANDHHAWLDILAPKCDSACFVTTPDDIQLYKPSRKSVLCSSASTSSASSSSLLAVAAAASNRSISRKSVKPYSFWSSRIAI